MNCAEFLPERRPIPTSRSDSDLLLREAYARLWLAFQCPDLTEWEKSDVRRAYLMTGEAVDTVKRVSRHAPA